MRRVNGLARDAAQPQARRGGSERAMSIYACLFLVFLGFPLVRVWSQGGWQRPVGVVVIAAFCIWYAAGYFDARIGWQRGQGGARHPSSSGSPDCCCSPCFWPTLRAPTELPE